MITKIFLAVGIFLLVAGLAYHFAALAIFNAIVPKDSGGRLIASGIAYGAHGRQRLDLYAPITPGNYPVILFVYGGSWDSGHRAHYAFVGRALSAKGYVVAIADYRLVPEVHYPAFVEDAALALAWLSDHAHAHGGDGSRLFAMGHSAGAYNVVQAVLRHGLSRKVKAIVALAGPFDFLPLDSAKSIAAFARARPLEETQPVNADLSDAPPILILHGADDTTVGLHNARNLHAAWLRAGRASSLKIYQGVGHVDIMLALSVPLRKRAPSLTDTVDFIQRYD